MKNCTPPWHEAENTAGSEHFWKLRCWKSARRCGAKHMSKSKSKCTKQTMLGALLEVEMFKKCAPLWHEAHFRCQKCKKLAVSEHFLRLRYGKSAHLCGAKMRQAHVQKKCTQHNVRTTFKRSTARHDTRTKHYNCNCGCSNNNN